MTGSDQYLGSITFEHYEAPFNFGNQAYRVLFAYLHRPVNVSDAIEEEKLRIWIECLRDSEIRVLGLIYVYSQETYTATQSFELEPSIRFICRHFGKQFAKSVIIAHCFEDTPEPLAQNFRCIPYNLNMCSAEEIIVSLIADDIVRKESGQSLLENFPLGARREPSPLVKVSQGVKSILKVRTRFQTRCSIIFLLTTMILLGTRYIDAFSYIVNSNVWLGQPQGESSKSGDDFLMREVNNIRGRRFALSRDQWGQTALLTLSDTKGRNGASEFSTDLPNEGHIKRDLPKLRVPYELKVKRDQDTLHSQTAHINIPDVPRIACLEDQVKEQEGHNEESEELQELQELRVHHQHCKRIIESLQDRLKNQIALQKKLEDDLNAKTELQKTVKDKANMLFETLEFDKLIFKSTDQNSESEAAAPDTNEASKQIPADWCGRGPHAEFQQDETIPLAEGRELGHGRNGTVVEATCLGVVIAVKKIRRHRKMVAQDINEINVLRRLSHKHIVKLIGTYGQRNLLGILLSPVARCDLAILLDYLNAHGGPLRGFQSTARREMENPERLAELNLDHKELESIIGGVGFGEARRIWASFGCLIGATEYLHLEKVRHKDIKPSNILFSEHGVWVTDFGASKDFSTDLTSSSESVERGTLRYSAPEVIAYQESGRSADIFSLGCVFLECLAVLVGVDDDGTDDDGKRSPVGPLDRLRMLRPLKNGSYEANLGNVNEWFKLLDPGNPKSEYLVWEVKQMLNPNRVKRPSAELIAFRMADTESTFLYGPCCVPGSLKEINSLKKRVAELEAQARAHSG